MPKLHKLRRNQKFKYDRNRKRLQKSQNKTRKDLVKVSCKTMKDLWDPTKAIRANLTSMGVAFDANESVKLKSTKAMLVEKMKKTNKEEEEAVEETKKVDKTTSNVLKRLEAEAAEATAASKRVRFRFPKEQVTFITYLLDKHGDDFKAMARDPKNIWQETPKQLRQKVVKFISIPEQFAPYAKERGLLQDDVVVVEDE